MSASKGANGSLTREDCERRVERALAHASFVKFMVEKMAEAGCSLGPAGRDGKFIRVEDCQNSIMGGFTPGDGVTVCHNNIGSQAELENTLTHELIHAYDHCRARGMDFRNCEHHACTEVRAPRRAVGPRGRRAGLGLLARGARRRLTSRARGGESRARPDPRREPQRRLPLRQRGGAGQPRVLQAAPAVREAAGRALRGDERQLQGQQGDAGGGQGVRYLLQGHRALRVDSMTALRFYSVLLLSGLRPPRRVYVPHFCTV